MVGDFVRFIYITTNSSGTGQGTVNYTVSANTSNQERFGTDQDKQ